MSRSVIIAMRVFGLAITAACFATGAIAQAPSIPCDSRDLVRYRGCAYEAAKGHATKRMAFWKSRFAVPLEQRIGIAPMEVVQFVALDSIANGIPADPRASANYKEVIGEIGESLAALPRPIKARLSKRLAGVYLVENFGGTGFTDIIRDESGREVAAFVILDPTVLQQRTANAWATWKESSPFVSNERFTLRATLEDPAHDTRRQAVEYILLHELGHVLSVGGNFHPSWNGTPDQVPVGQYPFFDISWSFSKGYWSRFAQALPEAKRVRYYFGANLPAAEMATTYRHLEATAYPTLYAATHPADDFAESFANYVHVVMLGKPFEITILEDGKVVERYKACWDEPRCAAKRRILEDFLR